VPFDDDLVDVGGVGGVHGLEAKIVQDQQVRSQQPADLLVVAVVEPGCCQPLEQLPGALEMHAVPGADGGVAQRGGQECLADRPGP
jgi:hypothetical protein